MSSNSFDFDDDNNDINHSSPPKKGNQYNKPELGKDLWDTSYNKKEINLTKNSDAPYNPNH